MAKKNIPGQLPQKDGLKCVTFSGPLNVSFEETTFAMGFALFKNGKFPELAIDNTNIYVKSWFDLGQVTVIGIWDSFPLNFN